jgi:hypothetical protein
MFEFQDKIESNRAMLLKLEIQLFFKLLRKLGISPDGALMDSMRAHIMVKRWIKR